MPQAVKLADTDDVGENETIYNIEEQEKISTKLPTELASAVLPGQTQVPVTESTGETDSFEIVQKPVKSVYIDKDVKLNVQHSLKPSEGTLDSANISTIQMTEVQQPSINTYQNMPKLGRSSVVQQLLRKVPTTGPPTLQVSFDRLI